jgi:DNA-directed RNA polymerase specialized sigma24 family protein
MMPDLQELYDAWAADPTPFRLGDLLAAVTVTVSYRYRARYNDADDVAQAVALKVWRSLPGYEGANPVRPFDPAKRFNPFVSCMARTTVIDQHKYNRLIPTDDEELERLAAMG